MLQRSEREALLQLAAALGPRALADRIGVGAGALVRAMSGERIMKCTATALRAGLDSLVDGPVRHRVDGGSAVESATDGDGRK